MSGQALAKESEGGGIVYSSEVGAVISAPGGWIFDTESGLAQGLQAVMLRFHVPKVSTNKSSFFNFFIIKDRLQQTIDLARPQTVGPIQTLI